jgi:transcriptional regulator with XRE-family HTH domain
VLLLESLGKSLQGHRLQQGFSQRTLAEHSKFSKSKICRIEIGRYPSLTVNHLFSLAKDLGLELSIRFYRRGIMHETRSGTLEYYTESLPRASRCAGQGFMIVWQSGPLCTQSDRNGATMEDVILAVIKRLEEFQSGDFRCEENNQAIGLLEKAMHLLQGRTHGISKDLRG